MSTTHHVKMAKASQSDIAAAIELYQFLEAMRDGRPAADAVEEFDYEGYGDLIERGADDAEYLLRAHERGGLFRVAWGLQVLLDPANEVVDPNQPHLELHPKHEQAAKERDEGRAQLAAVNAQRDELLFKLGAWCRSGGKHYVPRPGSSDSFGDGVRQAQRDVQAMVDSAGHPCALRGNADLCHECGHYRWERAQPEQPKPAGGA